MRSSLLRDRLVSELSRDGFEVYASDDGIEVLEWMADALLLGKPPARPHLLLAEADLPGRRGIDLVADLRAVGWDTPCVLLMRRNQRRVSAAARRLSSTVVLGFPFNVEELRRMVWRLLEGRRRRSQPLPAGADRRSSARVPVQVWAEECYARELHLLWVDDIGEGGVRLRHRAPRPHGVTFRLRFSLPEEGAVIDTMGEVIHVQQQGEIFGVGVRFLGLRHDDRRRIRGFVRRSGRAEAEQALYT